VITELNTSSIDHGCSAPPAAIAAVLLKLVFK